MRDVGLVLLAAGRSARMGSQKQLRMFRGVPMLRRAAEAAVASRCRPIVVVSGEAAEEARETLSGLQLRVVHNPDWEKGIGTSIHAGINAMLEYEVEAAVVTLADQPLLTSLAFDRLVDVYQRSGLPVVASEYDGNLGAPALFDSALFHQLLDLPADESSQRIIMRQSVERVARCACPEGAIDIDTPDDYERFSTAATASHAR